MWHLMLLLVLLLSQRAQSVATEHDDCVAALGASHVHASKGCCPAVDTDLGSRGAMQGTLTDEHAGPGMADLKLQQPGDAVGRLVAWGSIKIPNYVPPDVLEQGATDIIISDGSAMEQGLSEFLALLTNQSVVVWGGRSGTYIPSTATANVIAIAVGELAGPIALLANGTVPLIYENFIRSGDYVAPDILQANVEAIWAGADLRFAQLRNGSFVVWGGGFIEDARVVNVSRPASSSERVIGVAVGECQGGNWDSSCYLTLRANGSVIPERGVSVVPEVLQSNVVALAGHCNLWEATRFLALLSNGSIVQWSYNSPDELGAVHMPFNASGDKFTSIAAPSWAVTATGDLVRWNLSDLSNVSDTIPSTVQGGVMKVVDGIDMCLALKQPGPDNVVGFNGAAAGPAGVSAPAGIQETGVKQVAAGRAHAIAVQGDGRVVVWGDDSNGQLSVPQALKSVEVQQVAAAGEYCLAVTEQGDLYAWGEQYEGRPPSPLTSIPMVARSDVAMVAAGYECILALLTNGSVVAWGTLPALLDTPAAVRSGVSDIAVGYDIAIAALNNGSIVQWGRNSTTPQLEDVVSVAISMGWAAAVLKNGSLVMWPVAIPPARTGSFDSSTPIHFPDDLHVQRVAIESAIPMMPPYIFEYGLVLLSNGTLIRVTLPCNGERIFQSAPLPTDVRSGVTDMAIGNSFGLAVVTSNKLSTQTGNLGSQAK